MHDIVWHSPSPLWPAALEDGAPRRFKRPEVLRFATDTFMEDLQQQLDDDAAQLTAFVTRRETWQDERSGWLPKVPSNGTPAFDPDEILKLYQPAHRRFYLVGASLVCRVRGLPDRSVDAAAQETTTFVVRRLVAKQAGGTVTPTNPATFDEYGWTGAAWVKLTTPEQVDAREERLPMFPLTFSENGNGRKRRLLTGFLPVAKRETYEAAPRQNAPPPDPGDLVGDPLADTRREIFQVRVRDALRSLEQALGRNAVDVAQGRDILAFALLDLAAFLADYVLDGGMNAVASGSWRGSAPLIQDIFDALDVDIDTSSLTWIDGLADVAANAEALEAGARDDATPLSLDLDQLSKNQIRGGITTLVGALAANGTPPSDVGFALLVAVDAYLDNTEVPGREAFPGAPPEVDAAAGAVYVARCVYERPVCIPYHGPVVSAPTQAFQLASFFDPDAPVRPVRIALPVDTSLAGLRKAPKNVAVMLSDQLRNQMERVKGISALEDGDVGDEGGWTLGMICSLSIPIITICAIIILMIIVQLLNIVFWWLPFFKICLPIPVKK